jgi:hypothetical protein
MKRKLDFKKNHLKHHWLSQGVIGVTFHDMNVVYFATAVSLQGIQFAKLLQL